MDSPARTVDRFVDHLLDRADQVAAGLLDRTLPKPEWTHDGHLLACVSLVRQHGAVEALRLMSPAARAAWTPPQRSGADGSLPADNSI